MLRIFWGPKEITIHSCGHLWLVGAQPKFTAECSPLQLDEGVGSKVSRAGSVPCHGNRLESLYGHITKWV